LAQALKIKILFDFLDVSIVVFYVIYNDGFDYACFLYMALLKYIQFSISFWYIGGKLCFSSNWIIESNFFKKSIGLVPIALSGALFFNIDRQFINYTFDAEILALYMIVSQYPGYMRFLTFPLTFAFLPKVMSIYDDDPSSFSIYVFKLASFFLLLASLLSVLFYFVSPIFYGFMFDLNFGEKEKELLLLVLVNVVLIVLAQVFNFALIVKDNVYRMLYVYLACSFFVSIWLLFKDVKSVAEALIYIILGSALLVLGQLVLILRKKNDTI